MKYITKPQEITAYQLPLKKGEATTELHTYLKGVLYNVGDYLLLGNAGWCIMMKEGFESMYEPMKEETKDVCSS